MPRMDRNQAIPPDAFCTLSEAVVHLSTPDGVSVYRKQYRLAYHDGPVVAEAIEKWKADGFITEVSPDLRTMKWNNSITFAPKKDELSRKTGHRPCLDRIYLFCRYHHKRGTLDQSFALNMLVRQYQQQYDEPPVQAFLDIKMAYDSSCAEKFF